MKLVFLALLSSACLAFAADKPTIYDNVTKDGEELDTAARAALAPKYAIVELRNDPDYERPKLITGERPRSAKSKTGEPLGGEVTLTYVITTDGRATDAATLKSTDPQLTEIATKALLAWRFEPAKLKDKAISTLAAQTFVFEVAPTEFAEQILEPTGGKISRPKAWFYNESHGPSTYLWTISREDSSEGKSYDTGIRIQTFVGVEKGAGKSPKQFLLDFVAEKKKSADKVLKTCEPKDQGLFTRICLETEEGPYHILYSLFWGTKDLDVAVVTIAGAPKELWTTYAPTFDKMNAFELIDMKRFEKK